ncbi:MAG: hypothetical protein ACE5MH_08080, partial [Terriglobia bacterium]
LEETVRVLKEAKLEFAQFCIQTPLPGTALYRQYVAEGRIRETDWSKYSFGNVTFLPKNMTEHELKQAMSDSYKEFYNWKSARQRLSGHKLFRFPYGPEGFRLPLHISPLVYWAANIGISRLVQHHFKHGEGTRALSAPESEFERMRREQGRPAELPHLLGPRDPDSVPGAGDLAILSAGSVDRPAASTPPADD